MATTEEEIDPRIKLELERLNTATDEINSMELQLDEARASFRQSLTESTHSLNAISKKLGSCIEKARPYYEARQKAKECQQETQKAAVRFERANSMLSAAKEMVDLAEQGLIQEGRKFDANWQEMLNHATMKVGEAENEKRLSELEHMNTATEFHRVEQHLKQLQKSLRRTINKSRPYFEMKNQLNQQLEARKKRVEELQERVVGSKEAYSNALHNLEKISDEIHEQRRYQAAKLGERGMGVGAESTPTLPDETPLRAESPPGPRQPPSSRPPPLSPTSFRHSYPFDNIPMTQCLESPSSPQHGYIPEALCRDDAYVRAPKLRMLNRPLSLQESDLTPPDPHSILRAFESVDKLDEMSDTASCYSCDNLDDGALSDGDSMLSTPSRSRKTSLNLEAFRVCSLGVAPAASLDSGHSSEVNQSSDGDSASSSQAQTAEVPSSTRGQGSEVNVPENVGDEASLPSQPTDRSEVNQVTPTRGHSSDVACLSVDREIDEEKGSLV